MLTTYCKNSLTDILCNMFLNLKDSSHLLAILSLQVEIVGRIHASVHALFVPGDSALHSDPLRCWAQRKLLKVININGRFTDWWSGC